MSRTDAPHIARSERLHGGLLDKQDEQTIDMQITAAHNLDIINNH